MNDLNEVFYEQIDIAVMKDFAVKVGMDTGRDMAQIFHLIKGKRVLLELGAAYGRVVDYLVNHGFEGKIYAVDRSEKLLQEIRSHHPGEQVCVLRQDIKQVELPEQPEAVLWMWSGIMEMSPDETRALFAKIAGMLPKDGLFIIELPHKELKVVGKVEEDRTIRFETEWGTLNALMPADEEVMDAAEQAGLALEARILYPTEQQIERLIFVFRK